MDFSNKKFRKLLNQSYEMIEDWYSNNLRGEKIYNNTTPNEIKKAFKINTKNKKKDPSEVIEHLKKNLIKHKVADLSFDYLYV